MTHSRQTEIDWTRASQLRVLDDVLLPDGSSKDGKRVAGRCLCWVLNAIDSYSQGKGECYAGADNIALRAKLSVRHTKRAIDVLLEMSLLCCELKRVAGRVICNHYRIVWTELALYANRSETRPDGASRRSAPGAARSAPGAARSAPGAALFIKPPLNYKEPPPETPQVRSAFCGQAISEEVVVALVNLGLDRGNVTTTVLRAERKGVTEAEVRKCITHYQTAPQAWRGVGVLLWAIRAMMPGKSPELCFPRPSEEWMERDRRQRMAAKAEVERAARAKSAAAECARLMSDDELSRRLEAAYGPCWDALPEDERLQLIGEHEPDLIKLGRTLASPMLRQAGLEILSKMKGRL